MAATMKIIVNHHKTRQIYLKSPQKLQNVFKITSR